MNTFILFYKNQSDFKAITEYDDLDVSPPSGPPPGEPGRL